MVEQKVNDQKDPLSIWFFVGLILSIYGAIIGISGLILPLRPTVFAELRPAIWWGALMVLAGIVFVFIGLRDRR